MKTMKTLLSLVLAAAVGSVGISAQQLSIKRALNLAVAKTIAAAAEKEAMANKWAMFITIIDDGGTILFVERIDDAQIGSYEVSMQKAQTALKFRRPTKAFEDLVNGGRPAVAKLPGVLPIEGGVPLMADGKVIGAIGVSGGASSQDAQVAQAGVAALESLLKK
jgi:uncharacterized protein GlcG (DUF336 family)